jgi:hypothetical protein
MKKILNNWLFITLAPLKKKQIRYPKVEDDFLLIQGEPDRVSYYEFLKRY